MTAGRFVAIILTLFAGMIIGAVLYNNYYEISKEVMLKYDLLLMFIPSLGFFAAGYLAGGGRKKKETFSYRPLFQGKVQSLDAEGERIVAVALRRSGIVREKGGGR